MARAARAVCDCGCGATRDLSPGAPRPRTWWVLEQQSDELTTGPIDLASLACLERWVAQVRTAWEHGGELREAYRHDFEEAVG